MKLALFLVAIVTLVRPVDVSGQARLSAEEVHALTHDWVTATGYLSEARDLLNTESKGDTIEILSGTMTLNRRAKRKLDIALQQLPLASRYAEDTAVHKAVQTYRFVINRMQGELDQMFALQQKVITIKNEQDVAAIMAATAELTAEQDEIWKLVPMATVVLTYALVDMDRTTNGTLRHLRITTAQRAELLHMIRGRFPDSRGDIKAGQHAVDAAMSVLVKVLAGEHRSADAP